MSSIDRVSTRVPGAFVATRRSVRCTNARAEDRAPAGARRDWRSAAAPAARGRASARTPAPAAPERWPRPARQPPPKDCAGSGAAAATPRRALDRRGSTRASPAESISHTRASTKSRTGRRVRHASVRRPGTTSNAGTWRPGRGPTASDTSASPGRSTRALPRAAPRPSAFERVGRNSCPSSPDHPGPGGAGCCEAAKTFGCPGVQPSN